MRDAAFEALPPSLTRRISSARARSPSASVRAFLHSIIGASVLARSSPTIAAVIAAMLFLLVRLFLLNQLAKRGARLQARRPSSYTSGPRSAVIYACSET